MKVGPVSRFLCRVRRVQSCGGGLIFVLLNGYNQYITDSNAQFLYSELVFS